MEPREAYTGLLATIVFTLSSERTRKAASIWGKGLTAIVSGLNLSNEVFGFYYGAPAYFTQREFYKPIYTFGLRWDLRHEK